MQEERAIQKPRGAEKRKNDGRPRGDHPFDRKLEIEKRQDGGGTQVREERVEVQAAVADGVLFLLRQLRVDEKENQDEGKNGVHPRAQNSPGSPAVRFAKKIRVKEAMSAT